MTEGKFHLFDLEYISCEGNYRTTNVIIESDDEVSEETAQYIYYSNSDCWGDSPSKMVGGSYISSFNSEKEALEYCNRSNIFAEVYQS